MSAERDQERNQDQNQNRSTGSNPNTGFNQEQGNSGSRREDSQTNQGNSGNQWNQGQGTSGQQQGSGTETERTGTNMHANQDSGQRSNTGTGQNTAPFQITGNWRHQSSQLKERFSELTDSDLDFQPGQENQLMDQLGTKLNKSRDEVIGILNQSNQSNESDRSNESNQTDQFNL